MHEKVTASYSCRDDASGVAICGDKFYGSPGTLNTGILTSTVDTSSPGNKTFTVWTVDIAGNIGEPQTVKYTVSSDDDCRAPVGRFSYGGSPWRDVPLSPLFCAKYSKQVL